MLIPDSRSGTWATPEGDEFRWKSHKRRLQVGVICRRYRAFSEVVKLVKSNDAEAAPIARYIPYTRHFFVLLMDRHAALEVKDEAMGYMDHLIGRSFPFF